MSYFNDGYFAAVNSHTFATVLCTTNKVRNNGRSLAIYQALLHHVIASHLHLQTDDGGIKLLVKEEKSGAGHQLKGDV